MTNGNKELEIVNAIKRTLDKIDLKYDEEIESFGQVQAVQERFDGKIFSFLSSALQTTRALCSGRF